MRLLTSIKYLVTQNGKREILENVDLAIQGEMILKIGKNLSKKYPKAKAINCSSRIVMPGLINCHTHLGMTGLRGLKDDAELDVWLSNIIKAEHALSEKEIIQGALLGCKESLRCGTTTAADMYYPAAPAAKAAAQTGIRLIEYPTYFSAHQKLDKEHLEENLLKKSMLTARVTQGLGPHSIYGCSEEFLIAMRIFATKEGLPIHIHVAETRKERVGIKEKTGMLPVEYLHSIAFLNTDVLLAHCVWLTKGELEMIAKSGASVVHCPQSNMKLAGGGVMPLREMQERRINVCLGTDSSASNNSLDMFREMHMAALLHKHHYWDPKTADAQSVLDMATINGAKALGKLSEIGSIEEGKRADIITLDLDDVNLQPIERERVVSHLVYSANGMNVSEVFVDGELLLREKGFVKRKP